MIQTPTIDLPRVNVGPFRVGTPTELRLRPRYPLDRNHCPQYELVASKRGRLVVVAGRRSGKTTGMAMKAARALANQERVLYAGPTSDQTERFWYAVRAYFENDIQAGRLYKSETRRLIEPPGVDENGPRIRAKTAWNADTLRGDWGTLILLDEYSLMAGDIDEVVLPMLLDKGGAVVYGGTPKRRNHFFNMYQRAQADETGRWAAWHFTSHDNPHLSHEALAEVTADMTEEAYRQEILAEFLENEGAVFRNIAACMTAPAEPRPDDHHGHTIVAGVDWGKQQDFTAISVGCRDCRAEVARDRFNKIDYAFQRQRLRALCDRWNPSAILAESNAMGEPIIEQLQRDGLPVRGFQTTYSSKPPLIENLALTLERGEFAFQDDPVWTGELEAYERRVSTASGRSTYSAPEGLHDDTVISRALMIWQVVRGNFDHQENPFYA